MNIFYEEQDIRRDIRMNIKKYRKEQNKLNCQDGCGESCESCAQTAEKMKIITRFPPEPSGYLHIGHLKALFNNYGMAQYFNGQMILRFDDTNPTKESDEYENAILEDIKTLGFDVDSMKITHSSDHFDKLLELATQMIKEGEAFCDDTDPETLSEQREVRLESKNRDLSVEDNMTMWEDMQSGARTDCILRFKINMNSDNGCLRDPTIYRCIPDANHHRTGTKYKIYPLYDWACPIIDSFEGVTHVLRSTEFVDRRSQYQMVLRKLDMRCPEIFEYGKVQFTNAVMSKRKILAMIDEGAVTGWDDPRLATIRGILNRGMTVEGLLKFVKTLGFSKNVVKMGWDKIWATNKRIMDKVSHRYNSIIVSGFDPETIANETVCLEVLDHTEDEVVNIYRYIRNEPLGKRRFVRSRYIMISCEDFDSCEDGEEVTLMNWGNMTINKTTHQLTKCLENDVRGTKIKIIWLNLNGEGHGDGFLNKVTVTNYLYPKKSTDEGSDSDSDLESKTATNDLVKTVLFLAEHELTDDNHIPLSICDCSTCKDGTGCNEVSFGGVKKGDFIQFFKYEYYRVDNVNKNSNILEFTEVSTGKGL
jgi:glutamyl/glutaminyl-tRNA synthetase